ncbi:MAG: M23 family metallopeptidase [Dactylosporangium sp.]|nr:M23 family metallopeptidase [Dactylosporangium sp.]NNJ63211.1 M23 family metallopeptidase [Dactylosporangium sp.]
MGRVGQVVTWAGAGLLTAIILITGVITGVVSAITGSGNEICLAAVTDPDAVPAGLTAGQSRNALVIATVGQRLKIPAYGWVIAVATALQESDLINRTVATDHDSLGLFQQRPSQGWGTPEQIMNPDYAAGKFYEVLLRVDGWQAMTVTQAAQAVQRSAYPDAYARHEARARSIVEAFVGGRLPACDPVTISAAGWTRPVPGGVISGFRTAARPDHQGIDLEANRGMIIRAASGGVVVTAVCNVAGRFYPVGQTPSPCDADGYPGLGGCGWYLEIRHRGNVVSRSCHLLRAPAVSVGQTVSAGQPVGSVGSSGNSSGPHLHFEIHDGYPAARGNAIEPIGFLATRGVSL